MAHSNPAQPNPTPSPKRILLCGHRSFAATGLEEVLRAAGHRIVSFSRGPVARDGDRATGPVIWLHEHPQLTRPFDAVINYILLKDETIQHNDEFLESLLEFCRTRLVKHPIHISSMSVYWGDVRTVREDSLIETVPEFYWQAKLRQMQQPSGATQ